MVTFSVHHSSFNDILRKNFKETDPRLTQTVFLSRTFGLLTDVIVFKAAISHIKSCDNKISSGSSAVSLVDINKEGVEFPLSTWF